MASTNLVPTGSKGVCGTAQSTRRTSRGWAGVMGNCVAVNPEELEQKQRSAAIERQLRADQKEYENTIKILLLGEKKKVALSGLIGDLYLESQNSLCVCVFGSLIRAQFLFLYAAKEDVPLCGGRKWL